MLARNDLYALPGFYDPVSSISHLLGAVVFALLTPALLRRGRGDPARVAFLGVYALKIRSRRVTGEDAEHSNSVAIDFIPQAVGNGFESVLRRGEGADSRP